MDKQYMKLWDLVSLEKYLKEGSHPDVLGEIYSQLWLNKNSIVFVTSQSLQQDGSCGWGEVKNLDLVSIEYSAVVPWPVKQQSCLGEVHALSWVSLLSCWPQQQRHRHGQNTANAF